MNDYMQLAIAAAKDGISKGDGGPFGCVITQAGQVIAVAHDEVIKNNDCTCHGIIQAIRKACKKLKTFDLSGCNLYATVEPCPMCRGAIQWARIDKVFYGCDLEDTEEIGFYDLKFFESDMNMHQVDHQDCLDLFEEYTNIKEKIKY